MYPVDWKHLGSKSILHMIQYEVSITNKTFYRFWNNSNFLIFILKIILIIIQIFSTSLNKRI